PLAIRKPLMREGGLESPRERTALLFLLTWFGVVFVFFSLPRSKLGQYILPGIPPLAIIAGYAIVRAADLAPEAKRRVFGGLVVINAVIAGGVEFAAIALPWEDLGATLLSDAIAASTAVLVGSALTYLMVRRNRALAKAI